MNHWQGQVPRTPFRGPAQLKWFSYDSEERFNSLEPSGWTRDCITYSINSNGFRSIEFSPSPQFTVLSVGCSLTMGIGLPVEATWPELFCNALRSRLNTQVRNYNLGWPGASNDYISRTLYNALSTLNPNLVLVLFTYSCRREHITAQGIPKQIRPGTEDTPENLAYLTLQNDHDDFNNLVKNITLSELASRVHATPWLFATIDRHVDWYRFSSNPNFLDYTFEFVDRARDMHHPGPRSMERLAAEFINKYVSRNCSSI